MVALRIRGALSLGVLAVLAACGGGGTEPGGTNGTTPAAVSIVSGNGQTGLVGSPLSLPLAVKVTSTTGAALKGTTVNFVVTAGAATVSPSSAVTDSTGVAKANVTLGSSTGTVTITATVAGTSLSTTFSATAGSGTISTACSAGSPQSPAAGAVLPGVGGTGICLSGGTAGADYAIVAFNSNPDSNLTQTSFTVRSTGATALSTVDAAPSANMVPLGSTLPSPFKVSTSDVRSAFDARLRTMARTELAPRISDARSAYRRASAASFNTIPSTVTPGQILTLNAQGNFNCSNIINVGARVAAISNTAVIVADTANPAGGFTDAEYASFATTFDTLINPIDVNNFGQPTDIDNNKHILILFTKEVNKLTPKGSSGFIGGFFFERDLFPVTTTNGLQGCAGSNFGEMFYVMVPDTGGVFSDKRSKADVLSNTPGTLAHEFQHLINAGRRMYVNTSAQDFETVWLNEGLSHIAEELLYYKVSGNAPRQNIAATLFSGNQAQVDAFNQYASDNFGRYELFLSKPTKTSPYPDNDSLETRGATWNMLRYLADHRTGTSSDGDTWQQLVNATVEGHLNLARVFGSDEMTQIRNWATTVFSDDVAGVTDARFLESSYNMRSLFAALCANASCTQRLGKLPLAIVPLADAAPANLSIVAGGTAYLRFTVPAGSQASIDWSAGGLPVSSLMQFTVVRTR